MYFSYQTSQTRLNLQATLMMEEKRKENQSEELDASTLRENSHEASHNGSALPVSVKRKTCSKHFNYYLRFLLSDNNVGLLSTGSGTKTWAQPVLLLSVTKGSLCCAAPGPQVRAPAEQKSSNTHVTEPGGAADGAEGPEGPVWADEESAQVRLSHCNLCSTSVLTGPLVPALLHWLCFYFHHHVLAELTCFVFCFPAKKSNCWWTSWTRRKGSAWLYRWDKMKEEFVFFWAENIWPNM